MYTKLGWSGADHLSVTTGLDKLDGPWPHVLEGGKAVPREASGEHGKSRLPVGGVCCNMTDHRYDGKTVGTVITDRLR